MVGSTPPFSSSPGSGGNPTTAERVTEYIRNRSTPEAREAERQQQEANEASWADWENSINAGEKRRNRAIWGSGAALVGLFTWVTKKFTNLLGNSVSVAESPSPRDLLATAADTNDPADLINLVQSHANDPAQQAEILNTLTTTINGNNAIAQDLASQGGTYTPSWDAVQDTPAYDGYGDVGTAVELLSIGEMSAPAVNTDMLQQLQEFGGQALLDDGAISHVEPAKIQAFLHDNKDFVSSIGDQDQDIATILEHYNNPDIGINEQQLSELIGRLSEVEFNRFEQNTGVDLHALWDNAFNDGGASSMTEAHNIVGAQLVEKSTELAARTEEYSSILEEVQQAVGNVEVNLPGTGNPAAGTINAGGLSQHVAEFTQDHIAPAMQRSAEFIGNHAGKIGVGFAAVSTGWTLGKAAFDGYQDSKHSDKKWHHAFGQQLGRFGNSMTLTRNAAIGSAVAGLGNPVTAGVATGIGAFNLTQLAAKVGNHFTNRSIAKDQQTIESSNTMLQNLQAAAAERALTPMELAAREALTNDVTAKADGISQKNSRVDYWQHYTKLEWNDFDVNREGSFASKTKDNLHKAQAFGAGLLKSTFGKIGEKARDVVESVTEEQLMAFQSASAGR